ncbi:MULTISPECIES: hypothetical protein [Mycobacterium]|uniref:hypothetical protein n=1 Tax=Mycobacterium TaxID=1763 RepID=UPI0007FD8555|nr:MULTISPECIES: hypothetical protein [Mycobacterium]OBJ86978.1 hypothetical protein A9W96_02390 [Mycobacterium sp. 1245852.3]
MTTNDYYARLEADRAVTRSGSVSWRTPQPEPQSGYSIRDLPSQEFTLRPPNMAAVTHAPDSTSYQRATNALENLARSYERYRDDISPAADPAGGKYSPEVIREHVDAIRNTAAYKDAVRQVEAVNAAADRASQEVDYQRAALVQPLDAAGEQRNSRALDRAKRQLDNAQEGDYLSVVDEILSTAKQEQVGMLVEELPSLLKSKGVDPSFLDERFAAVAPAYGDAKRVRDIAQQAATVANYNLRMLDETVDRTQISADRFGYYAIPLAGADPKSRADYESGL